MRAQVLRRTIVRSPISRAAPTSGGVVANKSEGKHGEAGAMESYALGLGEPIQISAEHGEGLSDLYDALRVLMPEPVEEPEEFDDDDVIDSDEDLSKRPIRVAIVGRPMQENPR